MPAMTPCHVLHPRPLRPQPRLGRRDGARRARASSPACTQAAEAQVHVDRLLRQPRAGQPDHRPGAGRGVRAPQRGQRGGALRPERAVGHPVRGGDAARSSTSWWSATTAAAACWRRWTARASAWPTTGSATSRTCATATAACSTACRPSSARDALCDLNVIEQVVNVCVSTVMVDAWAKRPEGQRARLGLRRARRPAAGPAHDGDQHRRDRAALPRRGRGRRRRAQLKS